MNITARRRSALLMFVGVCISCLVALALGGCASGQDTDSAIEQPVETTPSQSTSFDAYQEAQPTAVAYPQLSIGSEDSVATVYFLDVGQGDSEFIVLPDGTTVLIDAGDASRGQSVVDYLGWLGFDHIDILVASCVDEEHIGGLTPVLLQMGVSQVWMPDVTHTSDSYLSFLDAVEASGASGSYIYAGRTLASGDGWSLDALAPAEGADTGAMPRVDAILLLRHGATSMLFCGDAPVSTVNQVVPGHVDVIKVANHGGEGAIDEALLSMTTPLAAIIECANDMAGYPSQSTLDVLAGVATYSTAANSVIVVTSDGYSIYVEPSIMAWDGTGESDPEVGEPYDPGAEETYEEQPAGDWSEAEEGAAWEGEGTEEGAVWEGEGTYVDGGIVEDPAYYSEVEDWGYDYSGTTVYITNTGTKYHLAGCRHLSESSIPISLEEAIARGYTPCGTCM